MKMVAASAMAVAFAFTGWATTAAVASAAPPPQASADSPVTVQDVWIKWKVYATHEKCRQEGRDMIGVGAVVDYRCSYDSPGWLLELRMVG